MAAQWHQLALPFEFDEPMWPPLVHLPPTARRQVDSPVAEVCEVCGWRARVHSVYDCDVDYCPFVLNFDTDIVTVERK